ncbi:hypothetical protein A11Q_2431 [Pseudobdellovibrio exovorus JSS]|uniref:Beta-lactamase n=2 Tax=Pseudobdellovibrio exovorus TaxID=453816 RepID=M4VB81_9BACT|nr:hypothetical protein A11Q_2431 [Pseudobdellovibrio exovorus JSS]
MPMFTCSVVLLGCFTFSSVSFATSSSSGESQYVKASDPDEGYEIPPYYGDDMEGFLHQECHDKKAVIVCEMVQARLWSDQRLSEALAIAEIICPKKPERCQDIYYIAEGIGNKEAKRALAKIEAMCTADVKFCDSLAGIYENQGKTTEAVKAAKKYYDKFKEGNYTWFAYKYNVDKKLAFEETLKKCRTRDFSCSFTLRYMPDHPQRNEVVKILTENCLNKKTESYGATECAIIGAYYFSKEQHAQAYQMWDKDCQLNTVSCLMILGGKDYSPEQYTQAMHRFCFVSPQAQSVSHGTTRMNYCPKSRAQGIPAANMLQLQQEGRRLIANYLKEQK